ncbi:unnamed protein product [Symbiodinium sp. KB8]|nr:unnamed protein product [Symbiodinium sp. KB8]
MYSWLRNMVRRSLACVCAVVALVEFPAFAGMNTHLRRSYKLQSVKAAYGDRFVTMAQSVLRVQGHDENVTRVALEFASASALAEKDSALALAKKDHDIRVREALEEAWLCFACGMRRSTPAKCTCSATLALTTVGS